MCAMSQVIDHKPATDPSPTNHPAPAEHAPHGALVGGVSQPTEITAEQALAEWWRTTIPSWMKRLGAQVLVSIVVVLFVLPLASFAGWINAKPAPSSASSSSSSSMANMPGMTATTASGSGTVKVPDHPVYDAQPPAAPAGPTVAVNLVAKQALVTIAPGIAYQAWTFNGTVPGPIIRVRQGQTVHFTLTNQSNMPHSIDFHAAQVAPNVDYGSVTPGKSFSFDFTPQYPGVFMYHCGTPPAMVHIANGMYGAIIVDPASGWAPAQEYVLVQSEFYATQAPDGSYMLDGRALMNAQPTYTVFNGYAAQYKDTPLTAKVNQKIRLFVMDAGPSHFSAFHVIGAIFSDYYLDGNPANHLVGDQTITVAPGGGAVVELTIPDPGTYAFVSHSFADMDKGAVGVIKVTP
jgi:nitrite reductase (NO-forming)